MPVADAGTSAEQVAGHRNGVKGRAAAATVCDGCGQAEPADVLLLCDGCVHMTVFECFPC